MVILFWVSETDSTQIEKASPFYRVRHECVWHERIGYSAHAALLRPCSQQWPSLDTSQQSRNGVVVGLGLQRKLAMSLAPSESWLESETIPNAAVGSVVPGSFDHSLRNNETSFGIMQA